VDLYALNIDSTASDSEVIAYGQEKGLTFPIGYPGGRMVADFKIKQQASAVALKPDGTVLYSGSSGGMSTYKGLLQELAKLADAALN
jgi:hypothetical protein